MKPLFAVKMEIFFLQRLQHRENRTFSFFYRFTSILQLKLSLLALHIVVYPDVYMMVTDSSDLIAISSLLRAKIHL